jgi:hypothetical protein
MVDRPLQKTLPALLATEFALQGWKSWIKHCSRHDIQNLVIYWPCGEFSLRHRPIIFLSSTIFDVSFWVIIYVHHSLIE